MTAHIDMNYALTWNYEHLRKGQHKLLTKDKTSVRSVCVSHCGNYALLGCSSGRIDVYNMQSGIYQFFLSSPHSRAITGLALSMGNRRLVSTDDQGNLLFWDFLGRKLVQTIHIGSPVSKLIFHLENDLIALADGKHIIHVFDMDTMALVRQFTGHRLTITGLAFSKDGKWLLSSSCDRTICTWDLISGKLLDILSSPESSSIPMDLALSPVGDILATCESNSVGITLWVNSSHYSPSSLPSLHATAIETEQVRFDNHMWSVPADTPTLTLSDVHTQHWQKVIHLDMIRERNKPIEPPKAPEKAPFFLEKKNENNVHASVTPNREDASLLASETQSRILRADRQSNGEVLYETELSSRLKATGRMDGFDELHLWMKGLSASAVDYEIRSLNYSIALSYFMDYIIYQLGKRKDYDLVQTYLNVFLRTHADPLQEDPILTNKLQKELLPIQKTSWEALERLFQQSLCFIQSARSKF